MVLKNQGPTDEPPYWLLEEDGRVRQGGQPPELNDEAALRLYRNMLQVRLVDERMMKLQRQGRLGFYMESVGEEAVHMAVHALRSSDWVFPSYREPGALFYRGYTLQRYVNQLLGNAEDSIKGRQMPVHHSASDLNIVSISSPVGTQIPQAVGMAWAARIAGKDDLALTFFGEGTTSTGDFHVGMNFAGVFKAPCIFVCRNNKWAISTPATVQTAARSFAAKALAYGFPGVRVDGNDLLAMLAVMEDAVARARAGDGPTLIEAVTYRLHGHSSSDDPGGYRHPDEAKEWSRRDPIERWKRHLMVRGCWSEAIETRYREEITEELQKALTHGESVPPPAAATLFDDVFATLPPHLAEQRQDLLAQPRPVHPLGPHSPHGH
ncbi:MAG TPA: thiamine pyrophosphate-dependent enzyme [Polyangia bacterium]|nr:thiamine pyrophosphate-dependent enzyme [Polyangia bacterium]